MQALKRQNQKIEQTIENYLSEIEKQKELNAQHESEIETLLKFNERLLGIIQNELSNNRKDRLSLNPISEKSERESDLAGPVQSFIRIRKLAPQSERGSNSLIVHGGLGGRKLQGLGKEIIRSQLNRSHDDHSDYQQELHCPPENDLQSPSRAGDSVKSELAHEIDELKKFKKESTKFYDNKISQIKNLSVKLNQYRPTDQLDMINQKLNISANTANLLKKYINKHA